MTGLLPILYGLLPECILYSVMIYVMKMNSILNRINNVKIGFDMYRWIKTKYGNPEVIIAENGWSDEGELEDDGRIAYLRDHLKHILEAMNDGCNVTGYSGCD